ncbi:MAG: OmpA family protein [Verrucomicrobiota bacterium]
MITFPRLALIVLASAAVLATGCTKKPQRPDPESTVMGQTPGGLNATDLGNLGMNTQFEDPNSLLAGRGPDVLEDENTIRGLLQPVYFAFNQSAIGATERTKLQAAQAYLQENPQHNLLLEGHCDWRGTAEYNLGLGDRRANSALQYLTSLGVDMSRLQTLSKGDLEAVENADDATMSNDRRVELVILKN